MTITEILSALVSRASLSALAAPIVRHELLDVSSADHTFTETDPPRVILVGGAGNITLTDQYDTDVTYAAAAGQPFVGMWKAVKTSGTSATNIVAQW